MTDRFTVHHYDVREIWSDRPMDDAEIDALMDSRKRMLRFALSPKVLFEPLPGLGGESWFENRLRVAYAAEKKRGEDWARKNLIIWDEAGELSMTNQTGAQKVQSILDRMFEETMQDGHAGVWTSDEWRAAISAIREEVPSLKLILIDAQPDWTHDDWANAVIQVRETLGGEDGQDHE